MSAGPAAPLIDWDAFRAVDLRVGRVLAAEPLPDARRPAWVLRIDFGPDIGVLRSSAQLTEHYAADDLVGRQVVAVVNLAPKQVGRVMSQCLVTGFHDADGAVRLCVPDGALPLGARLA